MVHHKYAMFFPYNSVSIVFRSRKLSSKTNCVLIDFPEKVRCLYAHSSLFVYNLFSIGVFKILCLKVVRTSDLNTKNNIFATQNKQM